MAKNRPRVEDEPGNPDGCVIGKKEAKTLTASVQVLSDAFLSGAQSIRTSLTLLSDTISEMALKIRKVSEGFNRTRKTTSARKEKGETVQESGIKATPANKANINQAKEKPGFVIRTFRSLLGFTQKGQHPGSIYTHDIHCEKILIQIAALLTQDEKTSKPKGSKPKSKGRKEKTDLDLQIDELRSKFPRLTKLFIDGPAKLKEEFKYWSGIMSSGWGIASNSIKSGSKFLSKSLKNSTREIEDVNPVSEIFNKFKKVFNEIKFTSKGFTQGNAPSGSTSLGQYSPTKKEIRINKKEDAGQKTVFHEMVHAIDDAAGWISIAASKGANELSNSYKKAIQFVQDALKEGGLSDAFKKYASDPREIIANFVTASKYGEEAGIIMKKVFEAAEKNNSFEELELVIKRVSDAFFELANTAIAEKDAKQKEMKAKNKREESGKKDPRKNVYLASGGPATPSKDDAKGTDTVPAMLTPGEFVVNKDATKKNRGMLEQINNGGKTQKKASGGRISYLAKGTPSGGGGTPAPSTPAPAAAVSPFIAGLTLAGKSLGVLSTVGNLAVGAITGTVGAFNQIVSFASPFVQAFNPALIEQMNLVFKDLTAVIGMALEPVIGAVIPIVRAFADRLVPVVQALIPTVQLFADAMIELAGPIIEILIEAFAALEPIIVMVAGMVKMWADILVQSLPLISAVIKEVVWWFMKIISTMQWAIGKLISMIPGTGNIGKNMMDSADKADKASQEYYKGVSKVQKAIQQPAKKNASVGAAAGKASFSGISDLGRNLMQASISSSTLASAQETAKNTRHMDETLTSIDQKMGRAPADPARPARGVRAPGAV